MSLTRRVIAAASAAAVLLGASFAAAEEVRDVPLSGPRVRLGDVWPGLGAEEAGTDLGPVPALGATRLFTSAELVAALPPGRRRPLPRPMPVRVARKTRLVGADEIERAVRASLGRCLRPVELVGLRRSAREASVFLPDGFESLEASCPKPPHHEGRTQVALVISAKLEGATVASFPRIADVLVPKSSAGFDVARGSVLALVIERGAVAVTADALANVDGDVGDAIPVTVRASGKTLRATIEDRKRARLAESP